MKKQKIRHQRTLGWIRCIIIAMLTLMNIMAMPQMGIARNPYFRAHIRWSSVMSIADVYICGTRNPKSTTAAAYSILVSYDIPGSVPCEGITTYNSDRHAIILPANSPYWSYSQPYPRSKHNQGDSKQRRCYTQMHFSKARRPLGNGKVRAPIAGRHRRT